MNFYEMAKGLVCSIVAVALSMTVAAVESLLPQRPDWLERVEHLALQLRTVSAGEGGTATAQTGAAGAPAAGGTAEAAAPDGEPPFNAEHLLRAYDELWRFVQDLKTEGLSLDDEFCQRIEREWSVSTLLAYVRSSDKSLQERAQKAMQAGAAHMFPPDAPSPGAG